MTCGRSDWRGARLACCSAGCGGAESGRQGKITLVLIKCLHLQLDLVCVYVDLAAVRGRDCGQHLAAIRGRDSGQRADRLWDKQAECPAHKHIMMPHKLRHALEK